jgi:hypothetical protein
MHPTPPIRNGNMGSAKYNPWSEILITLMTGPYLTSVRHNGVTTLGINPIIGGFHVTRVPMDGERSLIYAGT